MEDADAALAAQLQAEEDAAAGAAQLQPGVRFLHIASGTCDGYGNAIVLLPRLVSQL